MRRFRKLLWMIFIFWIVFFIICDEKWYKIWLKNNQIVFNKIEKKSDLVEVQFDPNAVYKNSDWIHINYEFENPSILRESDGMNPEYLVRLEQKKKREEERKKREEEKNKREEVVYTWPSIISLKDSTISSVFEGSENRDKWWKINEEVNQKTWTANKELKQNTWIVQSSWITSKQEIVKQDTWAISENIRQKTWEIREKINQNTWTREIINSNTWIEKEEIKQDFKQETWTAKTERPVVYYVVKKYDYNKHTLDLSKWAYQKVKIDNYTWKDNLAINIYKGKEAEPKILYKNSNRIKIYSGFENPRNMRRSAGMDEEFITKQENNRPTALTLNDNKSIISSSIQNSDNIVNNDSEFIWDVDKVVDAENSEQENIETELIDNPNAEIKNEVEASDYKDIDELEWNIVETWNEVELEEEVEVMYKVEKYPQANHSLNIKESAEVQSVIANNEPEEIYVNINKPELSKHSVEISEWKAPEIVLVKINKYNTSKHTLNLKKWVIIQHNFVVDNSTDTEKINEPENGLSDAMLENLLANEEIDIDALESENDEFLQKVFEQTRDRDVMNLIVETYLNEYQFAKAKKFIENLPDEYRNELKPSLNLRVVFNSFPLSSKTIIENLSSIVQDYSSKNEISEEDKNRYMWVIALMNRNYDRFFEISAWFSSEKNKAFASKLQWYKDQIAKQMWMPEYYFDTLVSLELFNQWLFQPAKVLALYSLQQNSSYILPYQVLAYANFLTNSWDTSVEYLKKLVDIDPNNAEKYRFLIWVASYRDEKYEQSVVMLAMIKDETLRLDTQRYLINNYIKLDQKNRLISTRNKLLWSENLVASDFYTYFYETFFHPYSEWLEYEIYAFDTELANKMLRVCAITLPDDERAVCTYWTIGRNIAMWQFDGLEQYLLNLVAEYPQWYLYQALWDYYVQQWDLEKAKVYLLKAISLTQKKSERSQIKKLLQDTM